MPAIPSNHLRRALFEQGMADRSATMMARLIHQRMATLHAAEAETPLPRPPRDGAET